MKTNRFDFLQILKWLYLWKNSRENNPKTIVFPQLLTELCRGWECLNSVSGLSQEKRCGIDLWPEKSKLSTMGIGNSSFTCLITNHKIVLNLSVVSAKFLKMEIEYTEYWCVGPLCEVEKTWTFFWKFFFFKTLHSYSFRSLTVWKLLSSFFGKNFVKATHYYLNKSLKRWFDGKKFWWEQIFIFPQCFIGKCKKITWNNLL